MAANLHLQISGKRFDMLARLGHVLNQKYFSQFDLYVIADKFRPNLLRSSAKLHAKRRVFKVSRLIRIHVQPWTGVAKRVTFDEIDFRVVKLLL